MSNAIKTEVFAAFEEDSITAMAAFACDARLPSFDVRILKEQGADAHILALSNDTVVGRLSLWWTHVPSLAGAVVGVVGHYDALHADVGQTLLSCAFARLKSQGVTQVFGPMDGNTWRRYRWVTSVGNEAPFFMEPTNPPEYAEHFVQAGFSAYAEYQSALIEDLTYREERVLRAAARLKESGVRIRILDVDHFEDELSAMHRLSIISFANNILYTPLELNAFVAQYLPFKQRIIPDFVFMAERENTLVGYLFAFPDLLRIEQQGLQDTVILKTAAVLPGRNCAGLGNVLVDCAHQAARQAGYTRAIHALSAKTNAVVHLSARYGRVMREYTLYAKSI